MTTLGQVREKIQTAMRTGATVDLLEARKWIDVLRTKGWRTAEFRIQPFTYNDLLSFMRDEKAAERLERAAWDAFLATLDESEAAE